MNESKKKNDMQYNFFYDGDVVYYIEDTLDYKYFTLINSYMSHLLLEYPKPLIYVQGNRRYEQRKYYDYYVIFDMVYGISTTKKIFIYFTNQPNHKGSE